MARDLDLNLARGDSAGNGSVRIPQMNQQKVVSQLPNSPRMQPAQISNDIGRALSGAGGAISDAGKAIAYGDNVDMRIQEMNVQNEKDKQTLAAQKAVSESSLALLGHFDEMKLNAQPGAVGFASTLTKNIDTHIEDATRDATPFYKQAYERGMIGVRQHLLANGMEYEYGEGLKNEVNNVNQGVETSQKLVYSDPSLIEKEMQRWNETIDGNSRFNPEAKRTMKESVRKQLVWAAGAKSIEGAPAEWNAKLNPYSAKRSSVGNGNNSIADFRAGEADMSEWEKRPDGSDKGKGFLGILKRPDGGVMTEYSIALDNVNGGKDFPVLVPTLTRSEVQTILKSEDGDKLPKSIIDKAVAHAEMRVKQGKPVFAQEGEQGDLISRSPTTSGTPVGLSRATQALDPVVTSAASATGVDKGIMLAQIQVESGGTYQVSPKGAAGVSQFMPDTAKRYGVDVNSPESSVKGQARYMADLLKMFGGDYDKALAGYNWGEGNVKKAYAAYGDEWLSHAPKETKNYVAKVHSIAGTEGGSPNVTGSVAQQSAPPATKIGAPWYDMATFEEQQQFRHYAETQNNKLETEMNKQRQDIAASLELETRNITEMVSRGVAPQGQPKSLAEFQAAYQNPERAAQAYSGYKTAWDTATETSKFAGQSNEQLVNVIKETPPAVTDPDFAVKSNFQQVRQQAAAQIITARQKDPWGYAQSTNDFSAGIADPSKKDFAAVIQHRAAALPQMMEKYGVNNASVLSTAEAANLSQRMDMMPATDRVALLKTLRNSIGSDTAYSTLLNQLRPDSPVTAMAGNIAAITGNVKVGDSEVSTEKIAMRMAKGEDLLNPNKGDKKENGIKTAFPMPKETEMRTAWVDKVGNAYAGFPDAENHAYQAFRAYYAARVSEKGKNDGIMDSSAQAEALDAATGGITTLDPNGWGNSYKVIMPYGMPADVFKDKATFQWKQIGSANGYRNTTIDDVRLIPTGENGKYVVAGADMRPLPDPNNRPITLDLLSRIATPRRYR